MITCLLNYKVKCEHENIDFNADKPAQYSKIREAMAEIYEDDEDLFGPSGLDKIAENASEEEKTIYNEKKKTISRGYKRIQEKIKDRYVKVSPKQLLTAHVVAVVNLYTNITID